MSQSLKKGIDTLFFLASRKSAGVTEVAEALNVNKSTAFRILSTFLQADMVEQNKDTQKYKLGPAILRLSRQYYKNFGIIEAAGPVMERLAAEIRESVHLCVLANNSAVIIEQVLSDSRIVVRAKVGSREPLHSSSVGKCLLAFAANEVQKNMLDALDFEVFTEHTIRDRDRLLAEIEKIRTAGFALDNREVSPNIICVAVPIRDEMGLCTYSLGTSGTAERMTEEKINKIVPLLKKAARRIEAR